MAIAVKEQLPSVIEMSHEESLVFFDEKAQQLLGISAAEFRERWDSGYYDEIADDPAHPEVGYLAMLRTSVG